MMRFDPRHGPSFLAELGMRVIDALERENHRWGDNGLKRGATVRRKCIEHRARTAQRLAAKRHEQGATAWKPLMPHVNADSRWRKSRR